MSLSDLAASKILSQDAAQTAFNFEQPGTYSVVLPNHVSIIWVDGAGGGGGAGGGITGGGGGAGGGGAAACKMFPIHIPANCGKLSITVGSGGTGGLGGAAPTVGTAGGNSNIVIVTNYSTYTILNLPGGFSAGAIPAVSLGGAAGYANGIWSYAPPAAVTANTIGNVGVPQPWSTYILGISTTGNMWSGSTGGGGGSWSGTGTGGNGGNAGSPFPNSGYTSGGVGSALGAGGGGGGVSWGNMLSYGSMQNGGTPAGPATAPTIYGHGGNGGGTGQAGTDGAHGFIRIYW